MKKIIRESIDGARKLGISDTDILNSIAKAIDDLVNGALGKKSRISEERKSSKLEFSREELEIEVSTVLQEVGMPAHIKGYAYTRYAIMYCLTQNSNAIYYVTKELYPEVAKAFDTTQSKVEKAIRHAVQLCWDRAPVDVIYKFFGTSTNPERDKATNSEFIAKIVDYFSLNIR